MFSIALWRYQFTIGKDILFSKLFFCLQKYPSVKKKVHAMLSEDKDFLMPTTLIDSNEDLAEPLESVSTLSSISKQDVRTYI